MKQLCKDLPIIKLNRSSDWALQLELMKVESLVIADQHAAVKMYPSLAHTARHTPEDCLAHRIDQNLSKNKNPWSIFLLLIEGEYTKDRKLTGVKS